MSELAIVIATNRPLQFRAWFDAWKTKLGDVPVYVIEDAPEKSDELEFISIVKDWHHYSWCEIDADLAGKSWIIPRRSSAIKSYGFLKAYQDGHEAIWTLDDDCFPEEWDSGWRYPGLVAHYLKESRPDDSRFNTIRNSGLFPRGYPYGHRQEKQPVMIHHGLWSGIPDLDGVTALEYSKVEFEQFHTVERVPSGRLFPMCGMNLSFRRAMTPAMYFMLQGSMIDVKWDHSGAGLKALPFDRFDDIWAGVFAKKVADHLGYAVTSGAPSIKHTKLSDPTMRVIKEGPGIAANELLWEIVEDYHISEGWRTVKSSYSDLAGVVDSAAKALPYPEYWKTLAEAMHIWTELFPNE
jgi:reversibly glycosylated polypeptide / UDP-arabinopyranose mutase